MFPEDENDLHETLEEARRLTEGAGPAEEDAFSLEEILAEYGGGTREKLLAELERAVPEEAKPEGGHPDDAPAPEPPAPPKQEIPAAETEQELHTELEERIAEETAAETKRLREQLPPAPRPISMEDVVSRTVDSVMEEQTARKEPAQPRRGLFSRRPLEETEELYAPPEPEPEPVPEWEAVGPEPDAEEEARAWKKEWERRSRPLPAAWILSLLGGALLAADAAQFRIPYWSDLLWVRSGVTAVLLLAVSVLGRAVFADAFRALGRRRCRTELLTVLCVLAAGADAVSAPFLPGRSAAPLYGAVACAAMCFSMAGGSRRARGMYDAFRMAAMADPPYMLCDAGQGVRKLGGSARGFYTDAMRPDFSARWQNLLLPLVLAATVVFAGLSSLGRGKGADFLLDWSATLAASASFALPLSFALPWSTLSRRLQKSGCAVAGWSGAAHIGRHKRLILSDEDLFPPGSMDLNGVKVFGEELPKAASYAASMAAASGSGLARLFDRLMRSEGGRYEPVEEFSFYEEGGCSGVIHGESVLMGTNSFMRKMEVRLPGGLNLRTGVFLAVDRQLIAVFAVKYKPSENVDWALRLLRRSRLALLLAARDPNVTPELVRRKFSKSARLEYPHLSERVALSEPADGQGMPRALLYREGLLPYAEAAAGSRRLVRACRRGTVIGLLGSISGTLLAFYLTFQEAYSLLNPLAVLVFQLLWAVPTLIFSDWVRRL